jgi:hypothetical protein
LCQRVENVDVYLTSWACFDHVNGLVSVEEMLAFMTDTANALATQAISPVDEIEAILNNVVITDIQGGNQFSSESHADAAYKHVCRSIFFSKISNQ